jgi:hypothetical protein
MSSKSYLALITTTKNLDKQIFLYKQKIPHKTDGRTGNKYANYYKLSLYPVIKSADTIRPDYQAGRIIGLAGLSGRPDGRCLPR